MTISNAKESSTLVGFEKVFVAIYDKAGEKVIKMFEWINEHGGTVNMKISGLDADETRVRASNKYVWVSKKGTGEVKVDFETFNPPHDELMEILGRQKDSDGIYWAGEDTNPPFVGIIAESANLLDEKIYLGLPKGKFGISDTELKTTEAKAKEPDKLKLNGSFIEKTIDGKSRVFGKVKGEENFEKFKKKLFGEIPAASTVRSV